MVIPERKYGKTLMIQGTTSDAGKTVLAAGLCRLLARRGIRVAPFKPQNMALNSAVTKEGGEIGRAQALQAEACYLEPHTDMNPVLLKPSSDTGAQVIVHGKAIKDLDARAYHDYKSTAMRAVLESHRRLVEQYDRIIVEGAGSPAEINLRDKDIANMGFAEAVDCPVILVADIDRGGVFAHLVGTLELLSPSERDRIVGFVINKFRGDLSLLQPGNDWLESYTGKPVLGVLPYLHGLYLDAEDAIDTRQESAATRGRLNVVAPVFPRISNHTDLDVFRLHPQVNLQFVGSGQAAPPADLIILPGSKSVRQDLAWLKDNGWEQAIRKHLRYGGKVLGICGGYQMLGKQISDKEGVEGPAGVSPGLGWLDITTELQPGKQLDQVTGVLLLNGGEHPVSGYEIHCGRSTGIGLDRPLVAARKTGKQAGFNDGAKSDDEQIIGTYIHGFLDQPKAVDAVLRWAGLENPVTVNLAERRNNDINRLADAMEQHIDLSRIPTLNDLSGRPVPCD